MESAVLGYFGTIMRADATGREWSRRTIQRHKVLWTRILTCYSRLWMERIREGILYILALGRCLYSHWMAQDNIGRCIYAHAGDSPEQEYEYILMHDSNYCRRGLGKDDTLHVSTEKFRLYTRLDSTGTYGVISVNGPFSECNELFAV